MRILLLKGQSQYDALRLFIDEAQAAFAAAGHEAVVVDLTNGFDMAGLPAHLEALGPFDLAFSYVILGDYRAADGRTLSEVIRAPHVIQHVDHPFSHLERMAATPQTATILTVDESHADVVKQVFGPDHFAHVAFQPHAGIGPVRPLPATAGAYAVARPIRFFFAGTYYRPGEPGWKNFPGNVQSIFHDASDIALTRDWIRPQEALCMAMEMRGCDAEHENTRALMPYVHLIHEWVRANRRFQFFKAATKAGLPLTVYGNGYDKDMYRFKHLDYRGPASLSEITERMGESRIVLNVNVNFGEGSHERPMSAMLAGAVCASESSRFYESHFVPGHEMLLFRWSTLEEDLNRLKFVAEDEEDVLFDMARAGQARAAAEHRWASRIGPILALARDLKTTA